jgi:branched-subunit amino acid ABC-type transport system permease component
LVGVLTHVLIVRQMLGRASFEMNIMVATAGVGIVPENLVLQVYGGYPDRQPVNITGSFKLGGVVISYQQLLIVATAYLLLKTKFGRGPNGIFGRKSVVRL